MEILALTLFTCYIAAVGGLLTSHVVVFGDSYSDNGDGFAKYARFVLRTNSTWPEEPYLKGRWSNGPMWIEEAAATLGVSLADYAAGGATTGSVPGQNPPLPKGFAGLAVETLVLAPTLFQQLNMHFLAMNNTLNSTTMYIIFMGGNDYMSIATQNTSVTAERVVELIEDSMQQLFRRGARKFLLVEATYLPEVPNFTDRQKYGYITADAVSRMGAETVKSNRLLRQLAQQFPRTHTNCSVSTFNFQAAWNQAANKSSLGLTNKDQPCYDLTLTPAPSTLPEGSSRGKICKHPDSHVYWDEVHPTRIVHKAIGAIFVQEKGGEFITSSLAES